MTLQSKRRHNKGINNWGELILEGLFYEGIKSGLMRLSCDPMILCFQCHILWGPPIFPAMFLSLYLCNEGFQWCLIFAIVGLVHPVLIPDCVLSYISDTLSFLSEIKTKTMK